MTILDVHPYLWIIATIFLAVLILIVVFIIFTNKLRKARPTAGEFEQVVERMSNDMLDQMNSEITIAMERFRGNIEEATKLVRWKLEGALASNILCSSCILAKENLILHILSPLERAIQKNNFGVMLSKNVFYKYRADLMSLVKDRHVYLQDLAKKVHCSVTEYFPAADEITAMSEEINDFWLFKVLSEYTEALKSCLEICYRYKQKFIDDNYRVGRIDVRIGKYQDSLANLERRFMTDKVAVERRAS